MLKATCHKNEITGRDEYWFEYDNTELAFNKLLQFVCNHTFTNIKDVEIDGRNIKLYTYSGLIRSIPKGTVICIYDGDQGYMIFGFAKDYVKARFNEVYNKIYEGKE